MILARITAKIPAGQSGAQHLFLEVRPKKRRDHFLSPQRNPHGIRAIDQKTGFSRVRSGEVSRSIPRGQFHMGRLPDSAIRRVMI